MTTHVLIVDTRTFKVHLEYMFAGTGAKDKNVDFNSKEQTCLHHSAEDGLVGMMADGARVRKGDHIIFYVLANGDIEGKFYGIFKAVDDGVFFEPYNGSQYLYDNLGKNLTFRFKIEPEEVYAKGVTEWQALDEIKNIQRPNQILWSLIYRKLRGNRGNTMITLYEAERLFGLIRQINNHNELHGTGYSFDSIIGEITTIDTPNQTYSSPYSEQINLLPRLCAKYCSGLAHEMHLQQYIVQQIGINKTLDKCLDISKDQIEWIGNEVACGVGMQRIDVMLSVKRSEIKRVLFPIELKAVTVTEKTVDQLDRYINWIEQYYIGNLDSIIQPVLICKHNGSSISPQVKASFDAFNLRGNISGYQRYLPLIFIQYVVSIFPDYNIEFNRISY